MSESCCCCTTTEKTEGQRLVEIYKNAVAALQPEQPCCCGGQEPEPCCCAPKDPEPCCCGDSDDSCCCGDSDESCCCGDDCCSTYSCDDEPYKGPRKKVVVDFLYLDLTTCERCQGADERVYQAVEMCRPILEQCGYDIKVNSVNIDSKKLCKKYKFYSSPTVRVNGIDVCPSVEEDDCCDCSDLADGADIKCRIFPYNGTYYECPPTAMLVENIMKAVFGDAKPEKQGKYKVPKNLKKFFKGAKRKQEKAQEASSCCCCC